MILPDRELRAALGVGRIVIDPMPPASAFTPMTVDLRLDAEASEWKRHEKVAGMDQRMEVTPADPGFKVLEALNKCTTKFTIPPAGYVLEPGGFILGWTREHVTIKANSGLSGRVEGKSSLARMGVGVHVTAPIIHPGFSNKIQLEITNSGPLKVRLTPNMPICQILIEMTLGMSEEGYRGLFQGAGAPAVPQPPQPAPPPPAAPPPPPQPAT